MFNYVDYLELGCIEGVLQLLRPSEDGVLLEEGLEGSHEV